MFKFYWSNQQREAAEAPRYRVVSSTSLPDRAQWVHLVNDALSAIRGREFQKVVLARRKTIRCDSTIDPFALCAALQGKTVFLFQQDTKTTFVGASPETLYRRTGTLIECDALAGTRSLGMQDELLASIKDRAEFLFVQNFLIETLTPLCCTRPIATPITVCNATTTCHLHSTVSGTLRKDISDREILAALHPTPAVGGYPRTEALRFIAEREPFPRGLYSIPIGWFSKERAEFAVAIRSALIQGDTIHLYAGVGIVEDSDPLLEWEETEQKLALWNRFFVEQSKDCSLRDLQTM